MRVKDKIFAECRHNVAISMKADTWNELIRFKPLENVERYTNVAMEIYHREVALRFSGWWAIKRVKEDLPPFPETTHLEEFLNSQYAD